MKLKLEALEAIRAKQLDRASGVVAEADRCFAWAAAARERSIAAPSVEKRSRATAAATLASGGASEKEAAMAAMAAAAGAIAPANDDGECSYTHAVDDVRISIEMIALHEQADAVMKQVHDGLAARPPRRDNALRLLGGANPLYHRAQLAYQRLLDMATKLLIERPGATESLALHEHINQLYSISQTGAKCLEVGGVRRGGGGGGGHSFSVGDPFVLGGRGSGPNRGVCATT